MKLKFPHIPRIFTAIPLWGLLLLLIGKNIGTKPYIPEDVITHPFSAPAHENFAKALWNNGTRVLAQQELAIAADLSPVLGADTTAQAQRESGEITYWQKIASAHPDYRDAYIQLATLSYAQGNLAQTKVYIQKAAELDPNGKAVSSLQEFITTL
jgi:tetratricopeptide (TPR) repeat protein